MRFARGLMPFDTPVVIVALALVPSAAVAIERRNIQAGPLTPQDTIIIIDSDWVTSTSTSDCVSGYGDDDWQLTLSEPQHVTITATDSFCPGDYFEVYVNDLLVGVTPNLAPPWGCDFEGPLSSESFTVALSGGTHAITVRDAGFDGHSQQEIEDQQMCPAGFTVSGTLSHAISIGDIAFHHESYPSKTLAPVPPAGTVDGNQAVVRSTLTNTGPSRVVVVRLTDDETGMVLPGDGALAVAVPADASIDVDMVWETDGFAWGAEGEPHPGARTVRIAVEEADIVLTERVASLTVRPRPVVLVHGLWSSGDAWAQYPSFLEAAYGGPWATTAPDLRTGTPWSPAVLCPNTIAENAAILADSIEAMRVEEGAWHFDIVAHSMGGLIGRQYIHSFLLADPSYGVGLGRLLTLGTPNLGTPCALLLAGRCDVTELLPDVALVFNEYVTDRKGVQFSALAGDPWLVTCLSPHAGDEVVEVESALFGVSDTILRRTLHTDMTQSEGDFTAFVLPRLSGLPEDLSGVEAARTGEAPSGPGQQVGILRQELLLAAQGHAEVVFTVPEAEELIVVAPEDDRVTVKLQGPLGDLVTEGSGGMLRLFTVEIPDPGEWRLTVDSAVDEEISVAITAHVVGSRFAIDVTSEVDWAAQSIQVTAAVADGGAPLIGARVTAELLGVDGGDVTFELFDDGLHSDGAGGDGLYGGGQLVNLDRVTQSLTVTALFETWRIFATGAIVNDQRGACGSPVEYQLVNRTVESEELFQACDRLVVGEMVRVGSDGRVTLKAGRSVAFVGPVSVELGATLRVNIDAKLGDPEER